MATKQETRKSSAETDRSESFIKKIEEQNPGQPEFIQAVREVTETLLPYVEEHSQYKEAKILERMVEPERIIIFRVPWVDDRGEVHVNRGYRVEMNSAIGPYKGGLRFHPSVNLSILKFLAFEQVFKSSLTTLPMGGAKGGADFDPKGKSDMEVMRFCQGFMAELYRHIGPNIDVPAGDIGVSGREIGYMFGQYKKLKGEFGGVLTGKGLEYGGSLIRPEATGYGAVYFANEMLERHGQNLKDKKVLISGSGNVAQFAAEKAYEMGGKVVTLSDSKGTIYDEEGIGLRKLDFIKELKNKKRGSCEEYADKFDCQYFPGESPFGIQGDLALPCATENEIDKAMAEKMVKNGLLAITEGANMPCTPEAIEVFQENKILYAPGKASNAGGVAVSGLEMTQNSQRYAWASEEVDQKLKDIMKDIHDICVHHGTSGAGATDYVKGANIAGFVKVANAMLAQGIV